MRSWMQESFWRLATCVEAQRGRGEAFDAAWTHFSPALRRETSCLVSFEEAWIGWRLAGAEAGRVRFASVDAGLNSLSAHAGRDDAWAFTRLALDDARQALRATSAIGDLACALGAAARQLPAGPPRRPTSDDVASSSSDEAAWRRVGDAIAQFAEGEGGASARAEFADLEANCRRHAAEVAACRLAVVTADLLDAFARGAEHEARRKLIESKEGAAGEPGRAAERGIALAEIARQRAPDSPLRVALRALRQACRREHIKVDLLPATAATLDALLGFEPWAWGERSGPPPHDVLALARAAEEIVCGLGLGRGVDVMPASAPEPAAEVHWPDEAVEDAFTAIAVAASARGWHLVVRGAVAW